MADPGEGPGKKNFLETAPLSQGLDPAMNNKLSWRLYHSVTAFN